MASARTRIATRFPTKGEELVLVSEHEDTVERAQEFVLQDGEYVYNAVVRTISKGPRLRHRGRANTSLPGRRGIGLLNAKIDDRADDRITPNGHVGAYELCV